MTTWHGSFFDNFSKFWLNLRIFFYERKTLFNLLFLGLYSVEQLTLFITISRFPQYAFFLVGGFIIIFLSTLNFERICMESRYTKYQEYISKAQQRYEKLDGLNKELKTFIKNMISQKRK